MYAPLEVFNSSFCSWLSLRMRFSYIWGASGDAVLEFSFWFRWYGVVSTERDGEGNFSDTGRSDVVEVLVCTLGKDGGVVGWGGGRGCRRVTYANNDSSGAAWRNMWSARSLRLAQDENVPIHPNPALCILLHDSGCHISHSRFIVTLG